MSDRAAGPRKPGVREFLELFALWGIALVQPMFDLLAKNAGVFITLRTSLLQGLAFMLVVLVGPPLLCWGIEAALALLWPATHPWTHGVFVAITAGIVVVEVLKHQTTLGPLLLIGAGIALGLGAAAAASRFEGVRQFLRYLAFAPVVFALLFLGSPAGAVLRAGPGRSAASVGGIANPTRVVFVVLDEFPEMSLLDGHGRVDADLFPNFAALAGDSTWYRNTTTVAPVTQEAVPALLAGRYPKSPSDQPIAADYPENLFTMLGHGYELNVHEAVTELCPDALCPSRNTAGFGGLTRQALSLWGTYASPVRDKPRTLEDNAAIAEAMRRVDGFIDSLTATKNPRLDFLHLEMPHSSWRYLATLQDYGATVTPSDPGILTAWTDEASAALAQQRHLLQVQAADTILGRIMDRLRAVGAYDKSLVVVTADHGVAFNGGQPARAVTEKNYPQIMWTPLFVKYPGGTRAVDDRPARSVDIVPTVADVLDIMHPPAFDGTTLRGPARAEEPRRMYQWPGRFQPEGTPTAPTSGRRDHFLTFDGRAGFAEVRAARAAPAGGDPALRIYRRSPSGSLIGSEAAPLVRGPASAGAHVVIEHGDRFANARPAAPEIPWAYTVGFADGLSEGETLALALNGTVVSTAAVGPRVPVKGQVVGFLIPPSHVRPGSNTLTVYLVHGGTLQPVPLTTDRG